MKSYYDNWAYLDGIVFNSAVLCESMPSEDDNQLRCNLLMAGNYAFFKNGPLLPIKPITEALEIQCRTSLEEIDAQIARGGNPEKSIKELGKEIHSALIAPAINDFLRDLIPANLPYFTSRSGVPLELIHEGGSYWSLEYGFGRMSGLDHFTTSLMTNLSVAISSIPKESRSTASCCL